MGAARMTIAELLPPRDPEYVALDPERLIQARSVAARYDISVRTLDRWLQKPHLKFPHQTMVTRDITGRVSARFWRVGDLVEWERGQGRQLRPVGLGRTP
jgi:hypothetical protein